MNSWSTNITEVFRFYAKLIREIFEEPIQKKCRPGLGKSKTRHIMVMLLKMTNIRFFEKAPYITLNSAFSNSQILGVWWAPKKSICAKLKVFDNFEFTKAVSFGKLYLFMIFGRQALYA